MIGDFQSRGNFPSGTCEEITFSHEESRWLVLSCRKFRCCSCLLVRMYRSVRCSTFSSHCRGLLSGTPARSGLALRQLLLVLRLRVQNAHLRAHTSTPTTPPTTSKY